MSLTENVGVVFSTSSSGPGTSCATAIAPNVDFGFFFASALLDGGHGDDEFVGLSFIPGVTPIRFETLS